eukprot:scpid90145/ scgid19245/ 
MLASPTSKTNRLMPAWTRVDDAPGWHTYSMYKYRLAFTCEAQHRPNQLIEVECCVTSGQSPILSPHYLFLHQCRVGEQECAGEDSTGELYFSAASMVWSLAIATLTMHSVNSGLLAAVLPEIDSLLAFFLMGVWFTNV